MLLVLAAIGVVAVPAHAQEPSGLDTTIVVVNKQAPVGGIFKVTGRTSCDLTDVMLKYVRFDGTGDIDVQQAKTTRRSDGLYNYSLSYVVPSAARPGPARIFADQRCGNPDAAPSEDVNVTITKATLALLATPARAVGGSTITVTGDRCYGDADNRVTVRASGAISDTVSAPLSAQRFSATFKTPAGRTGSVTFSVSGPDCTGSKTATTQAQLVTSSQPTSTPPSTPPGTPPAVTDSPSTSAGPSLSATLSMTTPPSESGTATPKPSRGDLSGAAILLLALGALLGLSGWLAWQRRSA